jgi:hypothetical protein
MNRRLWIALAALAILTVGLACDQLLATKIGDVLKDPRKYEGKQITISGTVVETVDLFIHKGFIVDDGTGQLKVVTSRLLPVKGQKVTVKGVVEQGIATPVILRESVSTAPPPSR